MNKLKSYWTQNRAVFISVWIIAFLILISLNGGIIKPQESATTVSLRWAERLHSHQQMLRTTLNQKKDYQVRIEKRLVALEKNLDRYDQQIVTYRFFMNSYDSVDAFETILQCQQIVDLHHEFSATKARFNKALQNVLDLIKQRKIWLDDLRSDLDKQDGDLRQKIEANIVAGSQFVQELERFLKPIEEMEKRIIEVDHDLSGLYETAQKRRASILDDMFFKKGLSFAAACQSLPYFMPHWKIKIQEWIGAQIPQDQSIWIRLLLSFAMLIVPGLLMTRHYVLPFLDRFGILSRDDSRTPIFMFTIGLFIASLCISLSMYWIADSQEGVFAQVSEALIAIALLVQAIIFRENDHPLAPTFRAYLPLIVQHIYGIAFYIALAPTLPLTVFIPPLNAIIAVWILWQLRRCKNHPIDVVFLSLSVFVSLICASLAAKGYPHLGYTVTLGWLIVVAQCQIVISLTLRILTTVKNNPKRKITNKLSLSILLPGLWMVTLYSLVNWLGDTYHLNDYFHDIISRPFHVSTLFSLSLSRIFTAILVAFLCFSAIQIARLHLRERIGDAIDSGVGASAFTLGSYGVWIIYILFVMILCEVNTQSLLVMIGGLAVGLGFALKTVAENFIAGMSLLIGQEIRPGDIVNVNDSGLAGKVKRINFRTTMVETEDGAIITYPNAQVIAKGFFNWTRSNPYRRVDVSIDVPYGSDLGRTLKILLDVCQNVPGVEKHPRPMVFISSLESSAIRISLRIWVLISRIREITSNVRISALEAIATDSTEKSLPQNDVNLISATPQEN